MVNSKDTLGDAVLGQVPHGRRTITANAGSRHLNQRLCDRVLTPID
jgi:hypothetical protein